ncbi:MAG: tetratricopeptide repeat protein [Chloroflexi bacterium]|nr:tetratricopeptide repeat protein [Chloroflexota bacterium]
MATAIVFVVLGVLYWLNFRLLKEVMWIFPGVFLWFSYRGLQSYYIYWPLLLLMALLVKYRQSSSTTNGPEQHLKIHAISWLVIGAATVSLVGGLAYYQISMTPLRLELTQAVTGISENQIDLLTVRVANTTSINLTPRFAIQSRINQPYPWLIESGPISLKPGEEGIYEINTDLPYRMIDLARGAFLVVTDASGDYRLRGTLQIQRDFSLLGPDPIFNSAYLHGPGEDEIPWGWGFDNQAQKPLSVRDFDTPEGFRAIEIGLTPTMHSESWESVGLSQWITFPMEKLLIWVYPPPLESTSREELSIAYGLEFDDGLQKLWILFGPEAAAGYLAENHYYTYQPAPANRWSEQPVDLRAIYDRLDWKLPPIQRIVRGDLELLTRMVTVKLIVAARDQQEASAVSAMFGPLSVDQGRHPIRERVAETVQNQAEYYTAIGDLKLKQRNFADASTDYYVALSSDPEHLRAYLGLGESLFWQGDYGGAAAAYRKVLEDPVMQAKAYKGLAWAKFNLGEYDLAKTYFQDSIRLGIDPPFNLGDSYNGLGWVYLRLGECEEAIPYFEQSLEINPEFLESLRGVETCRGLMQPD